ncbi:hypothetical protein QVD17_37548 [Tagetes erecta]|uniref:Dof zinc finger protein n=1 Tax=Tagetes erecta TaxID=13708 RepID=A0AAD8JU84_TARER|nr:hypothetical protein QVD17_37548 [Tagetes erecta]
MERGWKQTVEICPPCPRCGSSNTKFCYYNNYSLTQPRYFCKGCRRYWTKGGSLRNIPVGGGCRKTRRANKSIRVSDSTSVHTASGTLTTGYVDTRGDSASVSAMIPQTNIDLQQVYANFLNQRPQNGHQEQMHGQLLHGEVDPMSSVGFSGIPEMDFPASNYAMGFEGFVNEGNGIQFCGFNSVFSNNEDGNEKHYFGTSDLSNCGLPPLPGEELGWSELNVGFPENVLNTRINGDHVSDAIFRP